jgi:bacteriocin-like protein
MQPGAGSELSDEQLATIAGGWYENVKAPPGTFDNIQISWW